MSVIKIFNQKDKPYGPLSNNYLQKRNLSIEGQEYRTPSNFIYAQLLGGGWSTVKLMLASSPQTGNLFKWYKKNLEDNWQFYCEEILKTAINEQCVQSQIYKAALLSTKNSPILYIDEHNSVLGIKGDKEGLNLVGKALVHVRRAIKTDQNSFSLRQTQTKKEQEQFEAYRVFAYLRYYTDKQNKSISRRYQYTHKFFDMLPSEILKIIEQNPMHLTTGIFSYDNATDFGRALNELSDLSHLFGAEDEFNTYQKMVSIITSKQLPILSWAIPYIVERKFIKSVMLENNHMIKDELMKYYIYTQLKAKDQTATTLKPYNEGGDDEAWKISSEYRTKDPKFKQHRDTLFWPEYQKWKKDQNSHLTISTKFLEEVDTIISDKNLQYIPEEEAEEIMKNCEVQINICFARAEATATEVSGEYVEDVGGEPIKISAHVDDAEDSPLKILSIMYRWGDAKDFFLYEGYKFPTLWHYLMARLINKLKKGNFRLCYYEILNDEVKKVLLTNPHARNNYNLFSAFFARPGIVTERFIKIFRDDLIKHNDKLLKEILRRKFEHRMLQSLLLSTGNKTLVYDDPNNAILGNADKGDVYNIAGFKIQITGGRGYNRTGFVLTQLRNSIRSERKGMIYPRVSNDRFVEMLSTSSFLHTWLYMRIQDTCRVIYYVRHYLNIRKDKAEPISKDFVLNVLYWMYQPCSVLFEMSDDVGFDVPDFVEGIILNQAGFKQLIENPTLKDEIISVIWTKISVMVYFLIDQLGSQASDENITITLAQIQNLNSESGKCKPMVAENDKENCIFLALTNLLFALNLIAQKYNGVGMLGILEIETIISILLCEDHFKGLRSLIVENEKEDTEIAEKTGGVHILDTENRLKDLLNDEEDTIQESVIPSAYTEDTSLSNMVDHLMYRFQISLEDAVDLSKKIVPAIEIVKKYGRIPPLIKQNRINFFSQINNLST